MLENGWKTSKMWWKAELRSILRIQSTYNANCFFTLGIVHHPSINTYKNFWVLKREQNSLLMILWPWFYSQNLHCDAILTKLQQSSQAFELLLHHVHNFDHFWAYWHGKHRCKLLLGLNFAPPPNCTFWEWWWPFFTWQLYFHALSDLSVL